jgi:RHS repeat-associated protein
MIETGYGTYNYTYDKTYQLTDVKYPDGVTESYQYDGVGNRLKKIRNGTTTNYTYSYDNRMLTAGATNYSYDANGNQTWEGNNRYNWNGENQLVSINYSDGSSNIFKYDATQYGRRIKKVDSTGTKYYIYDGNDVLMELDGSYNVTSHYDYGVNGLVYLKNIGGSNYFAHQDALGSLRMLTNTSGTSVETFRYDAWGKMDADPVKTDYTYIGKERDKDSGLMYLMARYYKPEVGRFLAKDKIKFKNYHYLKNPIKYIDKTGLQPINKPSVIYAQLFCNSNCELEIVWGNGISGEGSDVIIECIYEHEKMHKEQAVKKGFCQKDACMKECPDAGKFFGTTSIEEYARNECEAWSIESACLGIKIAIDDLSPIWDSKKRESIYNRWTEVTLQSTKYCGTFSK